MGGGPTRSFTPKVYGSPSQASQPYQLFGRPLSGPKAPEPPGHSKRAGHITCQCHVGAYCGKYVIVVDEDIDVSNLDELIWAMLAPIRTRDFDRHHHRGLERLDPRISPQDKAAGNFTNSRAIIDACRPFPWRDQFPPVNMPSPSALRKAREKFSYLLE